VIHIYINTSLFLNTLKSLNILIVVQEIINQISVKIKILKGKQRKREKRERKEGEK
jgi:hypothetical protein